jgi:mono/diheme cytochrome c family protein
MLWIAAAITAPAALLTGSWAHQRAPRSLEPAHTTWDSVYTATQAARGDSLYKVNCVTCHGATLTGTDKGSPLVGKDFSGDFDGSTVGDLFDQIENGMPPDNPKTIARNDVVDIVAYLLSQNQFPAGSHTLMAVPDSLTNIKYVATKP